MSACPHCGHKTPPSPLKQFLQTGGQWICLLFISHVVPEPGYWTNFYFFFWWTTLVFASIGTALFAISLIIWLSDPHGYNRSWI